MLNLLIAVVLSLLAGASIVVQQALIANLRITLLGGPESRDGSPLRPTDPLMWIDKAETWTLAKDLGGQSLVDLIVEDSHTCYLGTRGDHHAWGQGCGQCPAYDLRAKGFAKFQSEAVLATV